MRIIMFMIVGIFFVVTPLLAELNKEQDVQMFLLNEDGANQPIGTITLKDSPEGLILKPQLSGLFPGRHGFHVHENPDCGSAKKDRNGVLGGAAGGHYDPGNTGKHKGPYRNGHLGDLPPLRVDHDGKTSATVLAPRLKLKDIQNRALMIHEHGDNYSDAPKKLGGGGSRVACGVIGK